MLPGAWARSSLLEGLARCARVVTTIMLNWIAFAFTDT